MERALRDCMKTTHTQKTILFAALLTLPTAGLAQTSPSAQEGLARAHSATQKAGLATLGVTALLGGFLAVNTPILGDVECASCSGTIGRPGYDVLTVVHLGFALATLGLYLSSEILSENMDQNPYYTGDPSKQSTMQTLRWVNVGLFIAQPVFGFLAAHPGLIGIPTSARPLFSRVMRTLHVAVGVGTVGSYSATAALQW